MKMNVQNNLLNYYEVRKNHDYLSVTYSEGRTERSNGRLNEGPIDAARRDSLHPNKSGSNVKARTRSPNLARVTANLSREPAGMGFEASLTPANSIDIVQSEIEADGIDNQERKYIGDEARDDAVKEKGTATICDREEKVERENLNSDANDAISTKEDDEAAKQRAAMSRGRRRSSVVPGQRLKRSYRHSNARPQLYDVVAKQRQFDRRYRLTDYEADPVKNRRDRLKEIFMQICRDRGKRAKEGGQEEEEEQGVKIGKAFTQCGVLDEFEDEKEFGGSGGAELEKELPVYFRLLAMQPALVPISMLLPPGGFHWPMIDGVF